MIDKLTSIFCRIFFAVALLMLFTAIWNKFIGLFGWTISWLTYNSGRVLEFSTILIIFAIAFLLKQIRDGLTNKWQIKQDADFR